MPGIGGLRALEEFLKMDSDAVIVMITAYATFDTAIAAWETRRFRLHSQAVSKRTDHRHGRRRHQAPSQRRRTTHAAPRDESSSRSRRDRRPLRRDAGSFSPGGTGRAGALDCFDHRRKRHRQRADRESNSRSQPARRPSRSSRSTVQTFLRSCSSRNCSATRAALSPARSRRRKVCSKLPTAARSFSTRSATFRPRLRCDCCALSRSANSRRSVIPRRVALTCASSPPQTSI